MARFNLQRVLDLKKRREEAMAVRLAEARSTVEEARRSQAAIESMRTQGMFGRTVGGAVPVGQLLNATYVIDRIDQHLDEARDAVRTAEAHEQSCLSELTIAMQERRVLDRLKERRLDEANAEEARLDRTNMDSIALTRFVRMEKNDLVGES